MSTSVYNTFQDIYEAVILDAKESTATTSVVDLVQRWINEGYEAVNFRKKRDYLDKRFVISLKGKVTDTFSVTEGSSQVVHTGTSTLLTSTLELGLKFSGLEENYEVESIVGTLVTLTTTFKGETNSDASGTLYQRSVILDESISEVYQVWHDYFRDPCQNYGPQRIREQIQYYPETYNKAVVFGIYGQSAESKRLLFWPFPDEDYTLYLDTNVYFTPLSLAADEPLIWPQYRQILYWYAIAKLWGYHRNVDREAEAMANFNVWLKKLDGDENVSADYPRFLVDYRRPSRYVRGRAFDPRYREDS